MQISDSIVIIPTYNERENIENIIRAVFVGVHRQIAVPLRGGRFAGRNGKHRQDFATRISRTSFYD